MTNKKIINISFSALFTAIICILAQFSFLTFSVPLTLQTLGVALCGYTLSLKWSGLCIISYVAMGTLGLPVFSNFRGGVQITLGPTGGFLLGFIVLILMCSIAAKFKNKVMKILFGILGIVLCHGIGIFQYSLVTGTDLPASFLTASFPFLLKDLICVIGAFFLSDFLKKRIKGLNV